MAKEIELKLALAEPAQRALLRHPLLRAATGRRTAQLDNIYYDTPDLALKKSGVAVRLRRQGRAWLQTVKCAGSSAGGLSTRPEWEVPYGGHFDFSGVDDEMVRARLEKRSILSRLTPLFETSFRRTSWRIGNVLVMLDRGWIAADGRREAVSEVELELAGGTVTELFAIAEALAERLPLMPAPLSKAERGFRLHLGTRASPARAEAIPLDGAMAPEAAFRVIALSCLDQMQRNHAGAIVSDDPEYIHQLRVATRRLRAALRLFGPVLPPGYADRMLPPLRAMMASLGRARDLDVLLAEICAPVTAALPEEPRLSALAGIVTERRFGARRDAIRHLESPEFGRLMIGLAAALHGPGSAPAAGTTTSEFARDRLRRLRRKVRRLAQEARTDDPASLHALRIGIKRLRYGLEFFAALAPGRRHHKLSAWLADLQDTLGELNDLANAGQLLMDCAGSDMRLREAVTLIGGWHGPHHARLMARLPRLLRALGRLPAR
jgi:adenylate cyclase